MVQYHWPGNARELKNVIERAMILADSDFIGPEQLPFELRQIERDDQKETILDPLEIKDEMSLEHIEKLHISKVLKRLEWNKSKAAKCLGISRATLREKIKRYNLSNN
jgi:two-component system response regulator HydG